MIRKNRFANSFLDIVTSPKYEKAPAKWYATEGLLSQSWQAWNEFCRDFCRMHGIGFTTTSGYTVPAVQWAHSEQDIIFNLNRLARGQTLYLNPGNTIIRRRECTWGDPDILLNIFFALRSATQFRETTILRFPEAQSLKHMQIVRNACAHINADTLRDVRRVSINYTGRHITHPSDLMFWSSQRNGDFAFIAWLRDIEVLATEFCK